MLTGVFKEPTSQSKYYKRNPSTDEMSNNNIYAVNPNLLDVLETIDHSSKSKILQGNSISLQSVNRRMQDIVSVVNLPRTMSVPRCDQLIPGKTTDLDDKFKLVGEMLIDRHIRTSQYHRPRITTMNFNCDSQTVNDLLFGRTVNTRKYVAKRSDAADLRIHYATMRMLSDFVIDYTHLTSLTLSELYLDGANARTLGTMLRNSSHLATLGLFNVVADNFELDYDLDFFHESFFNLKALTFDDWEYDSLQCIQSGTQLTSLSILGSKWDSDDIEMLFDNDYGDVRTLTKLTKLDLSNNKIEDLEEIAEIAIQAPHIKEIVLKNNYYQIDDEEIYKFYNSISWAHGRSTTRLVLD